MQPLQVQHGADDGSRAMRRPMVRRTVDHAGPGLKMIKDRIFRPELRHAPVTMPSTEKAVREMLPPAACRSNATSGICSRFVHMSSNKDRCPVNHVCWTPESRRLLASTANGMFTLWSGLSFNFETTQQAHEVAIRTSVWSHNGEWMISGDNAGLLKYWQPTLNNVKEIDAHAGVPVRELSFCPTDAKFCTCSDDGTVKVWDFETARLDRLMPGTGVDMGKSHSWDVKTVQVRVRVRVKVRVRVRVGVRATPKLSRALAARSGTRRKGCSRRAPRTTRSSYGTRGSRARSRRSTRTRTR